MPPADVDVQQVVFDIESKAIDTVILAHVGLGFWLLMPVLCVLIPGATLGAL